MDDSAATSIPGYVKTVVDKDFVGVVCQNEWAAVKAAKAVKVSWSAPLQAFPEQKRRAFCMFEYVYFARPDSTISGRNVYKVRVEMGRQLAREHAVEADLVIPVPDSGVYAGLGYAEESKIPFELAFIRNHYVGRSFLQPSQLIRDFNVRVKLNLIKEAVAGTATTLRRFTPKARGSAGPILKRNCHVKIVLSDE